jgi:small conductance mechanosensitive channel
MLRTVLEHDRNDHVDPITLSFLSHLGVLILWILLLTLYAHVVPALNRLGTTMLAGVGLVSVIVGFAAADHTRQSGRRHQPGALQAVPPRRPAAGCGSHADDFEVGTVEDITLGFTVLRTDDGREIIIANGTMAQQTMIKLLPASKLPYPESDPVA